MGNRKAHGQQWLAVSHRVGLLVPQSAVAGDAASCPLLKQITRQAAPMLDFGIKTMGLAWYLSRGMSGAVKIFDRHGVSAASVALREFASCFELIGQIGDAGRSFSV